MVTGPCGPKMATSETLRKIMKTVAEYRKHAEECRVLARHRPFGFLLSFLA
jgi:hypothetical protein